MESVISSLVQDPSPRARALELLRLHGDSEFGYLGLGQKMRHFFTSDRGGYIAYRDVAGFAVALGHPVGPRSIWPSVLAEFRDFCDARRLGVAFCGVARDALPFFVERGFSALKVGDDARIDLPSFDVVGRRGEEYRYALNRARRRHLEFQWIGAEARTPTLIAELRAISAEWLARRPYPELEFAMGTIETVRDPLVRLGIARRPSGRIGGFVTWLPIYGTNGWVLDLMRRRADAMPRLMDFLITRSLLWLRDEGSALASLGGSPLSNLDGSRGGVSRWLLDVMFHHLDVGYGFKTLARYKAKFHPQWEPLYLVCAPGSSLIRACYAVARGVATRVRSRHVLGALLWQFVERYFKR